MSRIAVDMDHVLADAYGGILDWLDTTYAIQPQLKPGQKFRDVITASQHKALVKMLDTAEFFANLLPLPGAISSIEKLLKNHEVFIATAAMSVPNSFGAKYSWIEAHLPFFDPHNIVYCGDKSIVSADYLIDDHIYNFEKFSGQGILFSASHNLNDPWPIRVQNWEDVMNFKF